MSRGEVEPARPVWMEGSGGWGSYGRGDWIGNLGAGERVPPTRKCWRGHTCHYIRGQERWGYLGLLPSEAREALCESQTLLIMN